MSTMAPRQTAVDWTKPIRAVGTRNQARLLGTLTRNDEYVYVVAVKEPLTAHEALFMVNEYGGSWLPNRFVVENVPPEPREGFMLIDRDGILLDFYRNRDQMESAISRLDSGLNRIEIVHLKEVLS